MPTPAEENALEEALDWLYSTQLFGIKLGLENTEKLLTAFLAYPAFDTKVIQVAGTNGKGSTCAFLDSVARAQGLRAGLFTSPHLIRFSERIRLCGEEIPARLLTQYLNQLKELVADWETHPTFFELSLALAMKYFKESECDLIILETGMGGRLDATTAVPKDLALITPIGIDHQQHLGDTLREIAGEKAGIMASGKPCITAPQEPEVMHVLREHANTLRCELTEITEPTAGYSIGLSGDHQRWNAALALEGLYQLLGEVRYDAVLHGLRTVDWPGRFQQITSPSGHLTVLDCAHNVPAAEALATQWKEAYPTEKPHLLFGAARDKNIRAVLKVLLPLCASVSVYTLANPRGEKAETLQTLCQDIHPELPCTILEDLNTLSQSPLPSPTLVTGSLFLVGEYLETL